MTLALFCAAMTLCVLGAAWMGLKRHETPLWLLLAMAVIPPALVTSTVLSARERMGDLRIGLEAISFDADQVQAFSIGGDASRDAVVVPGMHPAAVTFSSAADGSVALTFNRPAAGGSAGVVSLDQGRSFLGAAPFAEGSRVSLDGQSYTLTGGTLVDGAGVERPLGALTVTPRQILPLRERIGEADAARADFLYARRSGWFGRSALFLVPMSRDIGLAQTPATSVRIAEGETRRLAFYSIALAEPWEVRSEDRPSSSRVTERRSVRASVRDGRLILTFDTPERVIVSSGRLAEALQAADPARPMLAVLFGLDTGSTARTESVIGFDTLGEPVRGQMPGRLLLDADPSRFLVSDRGEVRPLRFGEAFTLGGAARAQVRVTRLDLDWRTYGGVIGIPWAAALAGLAAGLLWRRRSPMAAIVIALVETLLAVRILIAVEGAYIDAGPDAVAAPTIALSAFIGAPFLLTLAFAPIGSIGRWAAGAYAVLCGGLMAFNLWNAGFDPARPSTWERTGLLFILAGIVALSARLADARRRRRVLALIRLRLREARRRLDSWTRRPQALVGATGIEAGRRRLWVWAFTLTAFLLVLRIALAVFGIRERLPFGLGAISLFWTPAVLAIGGLLLWLTVTAPAGSKRADAVRLILFWGLSAVLVFLAPWLIAHDKGFAIQALPLMFLAALVAFPSGRRLPRLRVAGLVAPLAAAAAFLTGVALYVSATPPAPSAWEAVDDPAGPEAHALLRRYAQEQADSLRLQAWINPGGPPSLGSRAAEEIGHAVHHMQVYGSPPSLFGRGYLTLSEPTVLMRYHFDDNLSVVHLVSPFGRLGALMLVVVQWAAAGACTALALRGGRRLRPGVTAGLAAIWTFPLICAYMLLANLQVAPFTGRSIYLLAANSISDVVEGLLLAALALAALTRKGPAA